MNQKKMYISPMLRVLPMALGEMLMYSPGGELSAEDQENPTVGEARENVFQYNVWEPESESTNP